MSSYFSRNYTQQFKTKNEDIFKSTRDISLNKVKESFHRLNIANEYYSLEDNVKNHCFVLEKINECKSKINFFNINGIVLVETMVLDNWSAYSSMYQDVYMLYLLDHYYQKLTEN